MQPNLAMLDTHFATRTRTIVLVDYENIQPTVSDMNALIQHDRTALILFVGPKQCVRQAIRDRVAKLGHRGRWCICTSRVATHWTS